jgi:hypothetical protein
MRVMRVVDKPYYDFRDNSRLYVIYEYYIHKDQSVVTTAKICLGH